MALLGASPVNENQLRKPITTRTVSAIAGTTVQTISIVLLCGKKYAFLFSLSWYLYANQNKTNCVITKTTPVIIKVTQSISSTFSPWRLADFCTSNVLSTNASLHK